MNDEGKGIAGHGGAPPEGQPVQHVLMRRMINWYGVDVNVKDGPECKILTILDKQAGELYLIDLTPEVVRGLLMQLTGGLEIGRADKAPGVNGSPGA